MPGKIYLIDGSAYIFRAYYAVRHLSTSAGFPTNALYGFCQMLVKLLRDASPEAIAMVFDAGKDTFRTELYPAYKANRDECPEDLRVQMPFFREISEALGLPIFELPGFEADDVIGTLVERLSLSGREVVIVSGDKDLCQLVSDTVTVWDTMRDRWFDRAGVREKFGVYPEQMIDFLGLTGDSSDNIPGLRGVGPKTAVQLIENFGSVENIIKSKDLIAENTAIRSRKKIAETIELEEETLRLSKQLVSIECNAPITIKVGREDVLHSELGETEIIDALHLRDPDRKKLKELVDRFEFSSLFAKLSGAVREVEIVPARYTTIWKEDFSEWLEKFLGCTEYAFDLETTSLDPLQAKIVGASFCWSVEEAYYIPIAHTVAEKEQVSLEDFLGGCGQSLSDPTVRKCGQNLKYDLQICLEHGLSFSGIYFDTMLAAYLLDPDKSSFSLDKLAEEVLGVTAVSYSEVAGKGCFSEVPVDLATRYAAEDAHLAWRLMDKFQPLLKEKELLEVFNEIEVPLIRTLAIMERHGISLDCDLLKSMSVDLEQRLQAIQEQIFAEAGCEFNMNSPRQLSEILFDRMGIPTRGLKRTKTGISTDASVLEKLALQGFPLPSQILEYRGLHKLKSTYVDALPRQVLAKTGRLHTRFNQTGTATGRLSSSDPNLQNIPIQQEEGRRVRAAFVAAPGTVLISADYSQIELRLLAHLSEDEVLLDAFRNGEDVHIRTAREILGIHDDEEVSAETRRIGKTINFGIVYGMSGFRLARDLGIPVGIGNKYIENYFNRYAGVKEFFNQLEKEADSKQYVTTLFGRKRFLSGIESRGRDAGFRRRAAMNAPIQGSAADLVKKAMIILQNTIDSDKLPLKMLLQIHDELVFECEASFVESAALIIREVMENVVQLKVPLHVDIGTGKNWHEAH